MQAEKTMSSPKSKDHTTSVVALGAKAESTNRRIDRSQTKLACEVALRLSICMFLLAGMVFEAVGLSFLGLSISILVGMVLKSTWVSFSAIDSNSKFCMH